MQIKQNITSKPQRITSIVTLDFNSKLYTSVYVHVHLWIACYNNVFFRSCYATKHRYSNLLTSKENAF